MTRTLILMRHAKSSWSNMALPDHDRPLNKRGRRSAAALGDWLRARDLLPDEVLTSTATRTLDTLAGLGVTAPTQRLRDLYHAEADTMMEVLRSATGQTVLMLGHSPGIADCAARLVSAVPDHPRFRDYPTCATLVADLPVTNWHQINWGTARARGFVIPRELVDHPKAMDE